MSISIAPLQGDYSGALPIAARPNRKLFIVSMTEIKYNFKIVKCKIRKNKYDNNKSNNAK